MEAYVSRGNAFLDYGNAAGIKAAQADYERALLLQPTYLPARYGECFSGYIGSISITVILLWGLKIVYCIGVYASCHYTANNTTCLPLKSPC